MDDRLALPADTILEGRYRIMRVVGSGEFGITYEAEDIERGILVAIKEYYPVEFGDRDETMSVRPKSGRHKETYERGRASFLDEARTLARFDHPNIVRITRVFEANSTAYMVMRFEHGLSFEAWLAILGRPPTQEELDSVAAPLLDALQALHAADFLHGNLAPDTILLRADGSPVLLDFGAARRAVAEMSGSLRGSLKAGYSAPEQYSSDGRRQGPWSDLYALGATLYRAVAEKDPEEATLRFGEEHLLSAAQAAKGSYRPAFLAAIDACLKVRQSERPRSVAQLRPMLLGGDRAQTAPRWQPPRPSGSPGKPLDIADMRQWSQVVAAAQSGGLLPSRTAEPAVVGSGERGVISTMARPPAAAAPASRSRLLPALAIGAIGVAFGLSFLSRTVRETLGQLLAVLNLKLNAIPFAGSPARREPSSEFDRVDCSVFSPPAAPPGGTVLVQAFLHVKSDATRVSVLANLMDTATALKGVQTLQADIPRGARVDLALSGAGLEIEEPMQSLIWQGEPVFAQFLVTLPQDAGSRSYHPVIRLLLDGRLVGRIVFRLAADAGAADVGSRPSGERAGPYTYAFVSYASEDRKEVLKRVQMLEATQTAFFQDVLSLDPGARWEKEIYKRIDKCDLFLLFWSRAAKRSEWVIKEAEYALARQGRDASGAPDIVPIILEGPPPVLPPDSLRHLHFNDRIQYFIAAG